MRSEALVALIAVAGAAAGVDTAAAQDRPRLGLHATVGAAGFEEGDAHTLVRGGASARLPGRFRLFADYARMWTSDDHHDDALVGGAGYAFGSGRLVPYLLAGFTTHRSVNRTIGGGRSDGDWESGFLIGPGLEIPLAERALASVEARLGTKWVEVTAGAGILLP